MDCTTRRRRGRPGPPRADLGCRNDFRVAVPPRLGHGRRVRPTGAARRRRGDRPDPGRHLAHGLPLGPAGGRPRRLGRGRRDAHLARRDHRTPDSGARRPGGVGEEHPRRVRGLRAGGADRRRAPGPGRRDHGGLDAAGRAPMGTPRPRQPTAVRGRRPGRELRRRAPAGLAARGRLRVDRLLRVGRLGAGRLGPHPGHRRRAVARGPLARTAGTGKHDRRGDDVCFEGFPDEGLVFYEGLEADNSKTYWTSHKSDYNTFVKAPLTALLDELAPEFGTAKIFRPYRDVRFSNDKTPYKTHQGAVIHADGSGTGAWYVQISAEGLMVAGGSWHLESDQVARYRRAVADDVQGPQLEQEVHRLVGAGWSIEGDRLTRVPAGHAADAPRMELLKHKSLHA